MNISSFKSGKLVQRLQYKSFEPTLINTQWHLDNDDVALLLSQADQKLGELNAFSQLIPDVDFFIKMHVFKEGTKSSRIEGTQTNIDEALQKEEYINPEKKDDWQEVQNYVQAMNTAINNLNSLPLSNRLLKNTHKIILQGARGKHKQPGEFRISQDWIGGNSLADAKFIPPHQDGVLEYMSDLEQFIHSENSNLPHLIKIAILHYQFETIHPFLDGNGRIGRLLITLYLVNSGLLVKPTLYLSDFLEKNKEHYYDNLTAVRTKNDLVQWLKFFLEGIRVTAENSIQTFKEIIALRASVETKIISLGKKQMLAKNVLQYLYSQPITDMQSIAKEVNVSIATVSRLLNDFVKLGILLELTGFKRNRIFAFEQYLKLFR
ncbi:adenosine monophosphate-protein transferase SoFic [Pedobacter glucosidilyticus]|uniref:Fic family protein n=1 Tax=Pedobacter aquae TaxID=2605747 RepID=A0A5C0VGS8_9SPHI|nr:MULTISPECIES: Fic family protein [Pedobacter]KHJ38943.1 adenosine monophosphate-protein transferase SoFic [Pedobacter glucosidilyticus]QEK51885.1 Fic family protein [Pedobacter aquae]